MSARLRDFAIVAAACAVLANTPAFSAPLVPHYVVSTSAGSGASGVRDGIAHEAEFMKPIGVAVDAQGNIYVADAAAQRIRKISPDGNVRTIGGSGTPAFNGMWVAGGFRDGPAAQSAFNRPSGVAVAPDGGIYVADTLNHCIRLIQNGSVSTFAGSSTNTAGEDGAKNRASFVRPRALAFNSAGDLFVADDPVGVRKISAGVVTTLPLMLGGDRRLLSIAFSGDFANEAMAVGTASELLVFDKQLNILYSQAVTRNGGADEILFGRRGKLNPVALIPETLGVPMGLAAFPDGHIVYADTRSHALRSILVAPAFAGAELGFATPPPDSADYGGGYRDGALDQALFDEPFAVAKFPDGSLAVADTGNRRIRRVQRIGTQPQATPLHPKFLDEDAPGAGDIVAGEDPFPGLSERRFRIAYLGNSFAFYNTRWANSVPGLIEARLREHWRADGFPREPKIVSISPIGGLSGFEDYIDNILSVGVVDAVILQLNNTNIAETFPLPKTQEVDWKRYNATWPSATLAFIKRIDGKLRRSKIPLVVAINPTVGHVSPLEDAVTAEVFAYPDWIWLSTGPPAGNDFEAEMRRVVAASGARTIDLFPAFVRAELEPDRVPLYGTVDAHYSPYGRKLAANVIANALLSKRLLRRP